MIENGVPAGDWADPLLTTTSFAKRTGLTATALEGSEDSLLVENLKETVSALSSAKVVNVATPSVTVALAPWSGRRRYSGRP